MGGHGGDAMLHVTRQLALLSLLSPTAPSISRRGLHGPPRLPDVPCTLLICTSVPYLPHLTWHPLGRHSTATIHLLPSSSRLHDSYSPNLHQPASSHLHCAARIHYSSSN